MPGWRATARFSKHDGSFSVSVITNFFFLSPYVRFPHFKIKPLIKTSMMMESFTTALEGYPESFSKRCVEQVLRREMSMAGSVGRVSTADVT